MVDNKTVCAAYIDVKSYNYNILFCQKEFLYMCWLQRMERKEIGNNFLLFGEMKVFYFFPGAKYWGKRGANYTRLPLKKYSSPRLKSTDTAGGSGCYVCWYSTVALKNCQLQRLMCTIFCVTGQHSHFIPNLLYDVFVHMQITFTEKMDLNRIHHSGLSKKNGCLFVRVSFVSHPIGALTSIIKTPAFGWFNPLRMWE